MMKATQYHHFVAVHISFMFKHLNKVGIEVLTLNTLQNKHLSVL